MQLIKYRVRKFRSVQDMAGWITLEQVNALLGENESGKTDLLMPLWKLNPASGGAIDLLSDAPRGEYSEIRELAEVDLPRFITAAFTLNTVERKTVSAVAKCSEDWVQEVEVSRRYDGKYFAGFPKAAPVSN